MFAVEFWDLNYVYSTSVASVLQAKVNIGLSVAFRSVCSKCAVVTA